MTKLVASTTLLTDFCPMDSRCLRSHSGDGPTLILAIYAATNLGHRFAFSICSDISLYRGLRETSSRSGSLFIGNCKMAENSLAIPWCERQSCTRLGVTFTSSIQSLPLPEDSPLTARGLPFDSASTLS